MIPLCGVRHVSALGYDDISYPSSDLARDPCSTRLAGNQIKDIKVDLQIVVTNVYRF